MRPRGGHSHAAVGEGQAVSVAGQALLLTVVGAGGRGESVARADIVGVDGLPPGPTPVNREQRSAVAQQHVALTPFPESPGRPGSGTAHANPPEETAQGGRCPSCLRPLLFPDVSPDLPCAFTQMPR